MKKREPFEDDGRTIVDMSGIDLPSPFLPRKPRQLDRDNAPQDKPETSRRPWEQPDELDGKPRLWAALGALKAGLMIGAVYIVGLGLIVLLMVLLW